MPFYFGAFSDCTSLKSIVILAGVKSILKTAFYEPIQSPVTSQQIKDWLDYQSLHQGFVTKHNTLGRAIFNTI